MLIYMAEHKISSRGLTILEQHGKTVLEFEFKGFAEASLVMLLILRVFPHYQQHIY